MKPSDDAIVLSALGYGSGGWPEAAWLYADEIRGLLAKLGFEPTTQQVAAWLGRLVREDSPMFERRKDAWSRDAQYRVTRFGKTQFQNRFPGLRVWG